MKKIVYIVASICMVAIACSKEQSINDESKQNTVSEGMVKYELKVSIDKTTKASMSDKKLTFKNNDQIAIIATSNGTSSVYTLTGIEDGGTVTFSTELPQDAVVGDYAYFPVRIANATNPLLINWPDSFDGTSDEFPMMAKIDATNNKAVFTHLGSGLEVQVSGAPDSGDHAINTLEFKTSNNITGTYTVNPDTWALTAESLTGNTETVSITTNSVWYIPIPAGTYADFQLAMKSDDYYLKQKTANLASPIAPARKQIVNLGEFVYDVDEIAEWYLIGKMQGWTVQANDYRLIKVGTDKYQISSYADKEDPWYKFYSPSYSVSGVQGTVSGEMAADKTCKTETDEIFTTTLEKSGDKWNLSYSGFGSDNWDRCWALSTTTVYLKGDFNNWQETTPMTKEDHNNNMIWYFKGFQVPDNKTHPFKFYVKGIDWDWWIGTTGSVNISDKYPYDYASVRTADEQEYDLYFTLTEGTYDIFFDVRSLAFMFVKQ